MLLAPVTHTSSDLFYKEGSQGEESDVFTQDLFLQICS